MYIALTLTDAEAFALSEALRVLREKDLALINHRIDNPSASAKHDVAAFELLMNRRQATTSLQRKVNAFVNPHTGF